MTNKTLDERLNENHTPYRIKLNLFTSLAAGFGYALTSNKDAESVVSFMTAWYFGASVGVPIVNHSAVTLYRAAKAIGGLGRDIYYLATGKKYKNK
jgi:hypothetical protein